MNPDKGIKISREQKRGMMKGFRGKVPKDVEVLIAKIVEIGCDLSKDDLRLIWLSEGDKVEATRRFRMVVDKISKEQPEID